MINQQPFGVLFSDVFHVDPSYIENHGALDISLVADLPLFIDPFLLFHSEKPEYQALHQGIIEYLRFLRDQSVAGNVTDAHLKLWFHFKEVDNTWLGFAVESNRGSGLGNDFARALRANFGKLLDPEQTTITKSYHLEKLCLIAGGVGRDRISDFTTNLIKGYLCEYTQAFATKHIDPRYLRKFSVAKAEFNYSTRAWMTRTYMLPCFNDDFVLLVPADILSRDDTWINNADLAAQFSHLPAALPDDALRAQVSQYFESLLPTDAKATAKERAEAIRKTLLQFPELLDYYLKYKEDTGDDAKSVAEIGVAIINTLLLKNGAELVKQLGIAGYYDIPGDSYDNALARAQFLKSVIEDKDGYRRFWNGAQLLPNREAEIQTFFKLCWFGSAFDVNAEVNNGRGPVDFTVSKGSWDKTLIEFKQAKNSKLRQNLEKQLPVYLAANGTKKGIKVIIYFTEEEGEKLFNVLEELKMSEQENIVTIDARRDNKPSGSTT